MKKRVSIVLIGIGGYGNLYLKELYARRKQFDTVIEGVIDVQPEKSDYYDRLRADGVPVYSKIEDFYREHEADLAIISTPIHVHTYQTCFALNHGSHVLCEKPMCTSVKDAQQIIEAQNRTGKFVAIGFNWSFSPAIQELKQDIMDGIFGEARRFKTLALWPRNESYYRRSPWAGKKSIDGQLILDSVASNATSHFLHNMFYLLGSSTDQSTRLQTLTAELYRANQIENFDSCAVRMKTAGGVELLFYATHAMEVQQGPDYVYEFEHATVIYTKQKHKGNQIVAHFHDGTQKAYSDPEEDTLKKVHVCIEAIQKGSQHILCGPEAALTHVQCIQAMHESVPEISSFPTKLTHFDEQSGSIRVKGLADTFRQCFEKWCLPSEDGVEWSKQGKTIVFK